MSTENAPPIIPNPRIPKVLGILNIVFASALLLWGLCMGVYIAVMPMAMKGMEPALKKMEDDAEKRKKEDLDRLDERAKAARSDEERERIESERRELESRPKLDLAASANPFTLIKGIPAVIPYFWTEALTGLALNLMMLASGIALVRRSRLGITLGLWTAGLKIARLVVLYSFVALVIIPPLSTNLGKFVIVQQRAMGTQLPPNLDAAFFAKTYTIMYTIMAVGMILFGSIYPAVCLWLLSRPGARAACSGAKSPSEGADSW